MEFLELLSRLRAKAERQLKAADEPQTEELLGAIKSIDDLSDYLRGTPAGRRGRAMISLTFSEILMRLGEGGLH